MTIILYVVLLILLDINEFKKLDRISNDDLFYILSIDTLSVSLYMFMHVYKHIDLSIINILSLILLLSLFIKEKCSLIKTTFLLINIILLIKVLI